ncbi:MAG: hypothetical protein RIN56_05430 [Sporomusaceae bacterium]|nr:hypothetical protein [Sporomusaceae bacterium]
MKKRIIVSLLVFCLMSVAAVPVTQAINLGDILKVGGVAFIVDRFAGPLNNFINALTAKHNANSNYATKVVPIITLGSGGYVGAAQITGPQDLVDKTQAAVQVEADFNSQLRVKALIPIDSKNPLNFSRVQGVGVSAMIDVRI